MVRKEGLNCSSIQCHLAQAMGVSSSLITSEKLGVCIMLFLAKPYKLKPTDVKNHSPWTPAFSKIRS